jgi:hypothetical protein
MGETIMEEIREGLVGVEVAYPLFHLQFLLLFPNRLIISHHLRLF